MLESDPIENSMNYSGPLRVLFAAILVLGFSSGAFALATRTWVSGVGEDLNPCSRTAPCKTFAGAISKTEAGGEISVLDPGGFGAITITKNMSIVAESGEGGILAAGTNGVIVNAANIVVNLRGLIIEGVGTGLNGIRFINGAALHVTNCQIRGFLAGGAGNQNGILFAPTAGAKLFVTDTVIADNGASGIGAGVLVKPAAGGSANVILDNVNVENNAAGVTADGTGNTTAVNVTVFGSTVSGNVANGVTGISPAAGAPVAVLVHGSTVNANFGVGINANGANAAGAGSATVRVGNSSVAMNATGMSTTSNGVLRSYNDNYIDGNLNGNGPFTTTPKK
jgi:hypothetical protein